MVVRDMFSHRSEFWRLWVICLLVMLPSVTLAAKPVKPPKPPNIVLFLLDDLSNDAFNTLLDGGWLPNIQSSLVQSGVRFDNDFVTNPVCCPSRATFLTGQYSHNHGVLNNHTLNPFEGGISWPGWFPADGQPGKESATVAAWLQAAGYRTGYIGKYLNGYGTAAPAGVADPATYVPPGWSSWEALVEPSTYRVWDYDINENGTLKHYGTAPEDYQTDVLSGLATRFASSKSRAPFFLMVATLAPHLEVLSPEDLVNGADPAASDALSLDIRPAPRHAYLIDGDESNGEMPGLEMKPSFNEDDVSDKPSCPRPPPPLEPTLITQPYCVADHPLLDEVEDIPDIDHQYKSMLASVIAVDDMVGSVVNALSAAGKLDNTVIIFTSDNGWFYGEHRLIGKDLGYDESIRIPMVIRYPGGRAGERSSALVLNNDIAPTLADIAGVVPPYQPDGTSLRPLLEQNPATPWFGRKRFVVEHWFIPSLLKFEAPTFLSLRAKHADADWTYIASRTDTTQPQTVTNTEFYDFNSDPYQLQSVSPDAATTQWLDEVLGLLRVCAGEYCKLLESF